MSVRPHRISGVIIEAIYRFHECSVKSQFEESKLLNFSSSSVLNNVESSRKKLGSSLMKLIKTCVAESLRHRRQFRMKYTEDMHISTLETSLVSTANRLLDVSTNSDRTLAPVRPIARNFLSTLARLQSQVAILVDRLNKRRVTGRRRSRTSPRSPRRPSSSPSELSFFEDALTNDFGLTVEKFSSDIHSHSPTTSTSPSPSESDIDDPLMTLVEILIEIDHDMALLEFALVSFFSRRIRTESEADALQEVAVLFSETIEWALAVGLISPRQLADRDPLLFVAVPRLAVFVGCLLLPDSPIGPNRLNTGAKPPFMFAESTRDLVYLARQLPLLRADQLWRLACWTSPFGLSDKEAKSVDAATSATVNATDEVLMGTGGKLGIAPKTPSSLVFGWNTYGLHCIYKCISRVAGTLSTNHPAESRDILQMAIEINDPSPSTFFDSEMISDDLQPICPLDVTMKPCFLNGSIQNIRLADIFNWKRVMDVSSKSESSFTNLFQRRGSQVRTSSSTSGQGSPVEVGIDALDYLEVDDIFADHQNFQKEALLQKKCNVSTPCNASQPRPLLSVLRSTMILSAIPAPDPNPLYPLAPWQPDRFIGNGESDSSSDQDVNEDESVVETDYQSTENRRWRSGAPRVGRECARCKAKFMPVVRRRHHCRRCGHIFCAFCCSEKAPVASLFPLNPGQPSTGVSVVRVCLDCSEFVRSGLAEALDQAVIPF